MGTMRIFTDASSQEYAIAQEQQPLWQSGQKALWNYGPAGTETGWLATWDSYVILGQPSGNLDTIQTQLSQIDTVREAMQAHEHFQGFQCLLCHHLFLAEHVCSESSGINQFRIDEVKTHCEEILREGEPLTIKRVKCSAFENNQTWGQGIIERILHILYPDQFPYQQDRQQISAIRDKEPELGMRTPDGHIQRIDTIEPGVYWVDTGSHEFLVLSLAHAQRLLSPQASAVGETCGAWMFFEEDLAVAAPLFEHPEWAAWSGFSAAPYHAEEVLHHYFPAYFEVPVQLGLPLHDEQTEP